MEKLLIMLEKLEPLLKAENDELKEKLGTEYSTEEKNDLVARVEKWEKTVHKYLKSQRQAYQQALSGYILKEEYVDLGQLLSAIDQVAEVGAFGDSTAMQFVLQNHLHTDISELSGAYVRGLDKDLHFNMLRQSTVTWISDWSKDLTRIMNVTSHNAVKKTLTKGVKEGKSIDTIAKGLTDAPEFSWNRARTTALTEVLTAHSTAQHEAFMQNPAVTGKVWKHSGSWGIEPREHHVALDGTTIAKDATFNLDGEQAQYPRDINLSPKERVNCHCVLGPYVDDDILEMDAEEKQEMQEETINEGTNAITGRDGFNRMRGTESEYEYDSEIERRVRDRAMQEYNSSEISSDIHMRSRRIRQQWTISSTKDSSKYVNNLIADSLERPDLKYSTVNLQLNSDQKADFADAVKYLREETQKQLTNEGITHVKLYRGVHWRDNEYPNWMPQETEGATVTGRALTSWSMDRDIAETFLDDQTGAIFEATVPVEKVFGLFDFRKETEVAVMGDIAGAKVSLSKVAQMQYNKKVKKVELIFQEKVIIPDSLADWLKESRED